jgi:hypothetical protein
LMAGFRILLSLLVLVASCSNPVGVITSLCHCIAGSRELTHRLTIGLGALCTLRLGRPFWTGRQGLRGGNRAREVHRLGF